MAMMIAVIIALNIPIVNAIFPMRVRVRLAITGILVAVSSSPVTILTRKPKTRNFIWFILI